MNIATRTPPGSGFADGQLVALVTDAQIDELETAIADFQGTPQQIAGALVFGGSPFSGIRDAARQTGFSPACISAAAMRIIRASGLTKRLLTVEHRLKLSAAIRARWAAMSDEQRAAAREKLRLAHPVALATKKKAEKTKARRRERYLREKAAASTKSTTAFSLSTTIQNEGPGR